MSYEWIRSTPTCSNRCAVTVKSDTTNSTPTLEPDNDVDEVESMGFNELASLPTPVVVFGSFVVVILVVALLMVALLAMVVVVRFPGVVISTLEARRVSGPTTKR